MDFNMTRMLGEDRTVRAKALKVGKPRLNQKSESFRWSTGYEGFGRSKVGGAGRWVAFKGRLVSLPQKGFERAGHFLLRILL